ncbi:nicotinate-nucleotide--dimethylbenzimidazole phosphoribosyltransferase [Dinghuibacter silviterrae]|uniref:Nicotinate-nucleotide--dimethylbenzimidazole phosphoribosyltransferase n=1 Tax=Dinghuibacter silviterrae TaxID=1539049 RepID=A0A4R8DQ88_9BACT|nr:nicotinate-nucleotide--dimethylbenzimidazole phosphoribosyltransferase [Dinghuibacter silviterrae]TDX00079.1 nicotinate-nucleotide-dimethylbenzimidazole phosphoribosyltransferase [Dinghuibacter silviterrae]
MLITPDASLREALLDKINHKTKPPGSLGQLEDLALQLGLIQQTLTPAVVRPSLLVFAGDHGIAATGLVNPYPQAVTAQMVVNFIRGGAAINVFCRLNDIALKVVDAGVNMVFDPEVLDSPLFYNASIARGTRNYLEGPAMTARECQAALDKGASLVDELQATGCNTVAFGEMGIGNTTSAALIMASLTGIPLASCIGRGTGVTDTQLDTKRATAARALSLHPVRNGREALQAFGGFEIAMMTGAMLRAAENGMTIIVDGFITSAALLAAHDMEPAVLDYCIFAHESHEQGHRRLLEYLHVKPLLRLDLRLGEGTGAALVVPLVRAAAAFLVEMASFADAGVSQAGEDAAAGAAGKEVAP